MHGSIGHRNGRFTIDSSKPIQNSPKDNSRGLLKQPNKQRGLFPKTQPISNTCDNEKPQKCARLGLRERTPSAKPARTVIKHELNLNESAESQSSEFCEPNVPRSVLREEINRFVTDAQNAASTSDQPDNDKPQKCARLGLCERTPSAIPARTVIKNEFNLNESAECQSSEFCEPNVPRPVSREEINRFVTDAQNAASTSDQPDSNFNYSRKERSIDPEPSTGDNNDKRTPKVLSTNKTEMRSNSRNPVGDQHNSELRTAFGRTLKPHEKITSSFILKKPTNKKAIKPKPINKTESLSAKVVQELDNETPQRSDEPQNSVFDRLYRWKSRRNSVVVAVRPYNSLSVSKSPPNLHSVPKRTPRSGLLVDEHEQNTFVKTTSASTMPQKCETCESQVASEEPADPSMAFLPFHYSEEKEEIIVEISEQKQGHFEDYSYSLPIDTEIEPILKPITNVDQSIRYLTQKSPEPLDENIGCEENSTSFTISVSKMIDSECSHIAAVFELDNASVQGPQTASLGEMEEIKFIGKKSNQMESLNTKRSKEFETLSAPCASELADRIHQGLDTPEGESLEDEQLAEENMKPGSVLGARCILGQNDDFIVHAVTETLEGKVFVSNEEKNEKLPDIPPPMIPERFISNLNENIMSDGTYIKSLPNSSIKFRLSALPKSSDQVDDPTSIRRDEQLEYPQPRLDSKGNMHIPPANLIEIDGKGVQLQKVFDLIHDSKNNLDDLKFDIGFSTIISSEKLSDIKRRYRNTIIPIKNALTATEIEIPEENRHNLLQMLVPAVESFIYVADKQILNACWVGVWEKSNIIRQKADFLRYLHEVLPENEDYLKRCQLAYKDAKLFFIENKLQSQAEWIYLQMNYAAFLYITGAREAAIFITQKLMKSLTAKRSGKDVMARLASNLKFYSQM